MGQLVHYKYNLRGKLYFLNAPLPLILDGNSDVSITFPFLSQALNPSNLFSQKTYKIKKCNFIMQMINSLNPAENLSGKTLKYTKQTIDYRDKH